MWDWLNKLDRKCTFHEVCKSLILRTSYTTISFQPWTMSSIFCLFEEIYKKFVIDSSRQIDKSSHRPFLPNPKPLAHEILLRSKKVIHLYLYICWKQWKLKIGIKSSQWPFSNFQNLLRANDLHRLRIRKLSFPKTSCHIPFSEMLDFINHAT